MRQFHGIVVMLVVLLAGCAGGIQSDFAEQEPQGTPVGSTSVATPSDEEAAAQVGSIAGHVTDEELRPLPDAVVRLPDLGASLNVDEAGAFEFLDMPAGRHVLEAQAPEHTGEARRVVVEAGEAIDVTFALASLPVDEAWVHTETHAVQVTGPGHFTRMMSRFVPLSCNANCTWWVSLPETKPVFAQFEFLGQHSVANPRGWDGLRVQVHGFAENSTSNARVLRLCGGEMTSDPNRECLRLPVIFSFEKSDLDESDPNSVVPERFRLLIDCEDAWVCLDDRYEGWVSLFYGYEREKIPPDYSAVPDGR